MNTTTRLAGIAAAATLGLGSLAVSTGIATAANASGSAKPAACSQQQKQLDKANDALARVTAVFDKQQAKVKKDKHEAAAADSAHARNEARHQMTKDKQVRDHAAKEKKAQQQRVAKAQFRLDKCQAGTTGQSGTHGQSGIHSQSGTHGKPSN